MNAESQLHHAHSFKLMAIIQSIVSFTVPPKCSFSRSSCLRNSVSSSIIPTLMQQLGPAELPSMICELPSMICELPSMIPEWNNTWSTMSLAGLRRHVYRRQQRVRSNGLHSSLAWPQLKMYISSHGQQWKYLQSQPVLPTANITTDDWITDWNNYCHGLCLQYPLSRPMLAISTVTANVCNIHCHGLCLQYPLSRSWFATSTVTASVIHVYISSHALSRPSQVISSHDSQAPPYNMHRRVQVPQP